MKDLGRPKQLLGIDLTWNQNGSVLNSQKQLIAQLLHATEIQDAKADGSPIAIPILFSPAHQQMLSQADKIIYRSQVGSFIYLDTRPHLDLCVAASMMSSHVDAPTQVYMNIAHQKLRYLRVTVNAALMLKPGHDDQLHANVYTVWCSEAERKICSRSGIWTVLGKTLIYTFCQLKNCISLSSTEAEYAAVSEADKTIT